MHSIGLMGALPYATGVPTRQISAENPTGEKGHGATAVPDEAAPHSRPASELGRGWKVSPFIKLTAGETVQLAHIEGPGCINQLYFTSDLAAWRALILRIYWDDEELPSVEVPVGDFFAIGHDSAPHQVYSTAVTVAPNRGCSAYWQMPFRKRCVITLQNGGPIDANIVAYRILYKLHEVSDDAAYFHAQWRRSMTTRAHPEHTILDGVAGRGLYVGTYIAWSALSSGWWGEGEVKFFIDGDKEFPTLCDNGTEDYFGGAWNFWVNGLEREFNSPFLGLPLARSDDRQGPRLFSLYRWHLLDCIGFSENLRVTIQALGWWPDKKYQPLTDDVASVAYWYQREPHTHFPQLPTIENRWGR